LLLDGNPLEYPLKDLEYPLEDSFGNPLMTPLEYGFLMGSFEVPLGNPLTLEECLLMGSFEGEPVWKTVDGSSRRMFLDGEL
jgi:hypothetical protein